MASRPARPCHFVRCTRPATHRAKLRAFRSPLFATTHRAVSAEVCQHHGRAFLMFYGPLRRPAVYRFRRLP